ncbi:MAG: DUF2304 domain-containing protein [Chloroflexi bacterium]|nr:MAG: DUF2304 domain-containing protein [Phototrophicales bacterium]RMF80028.1 MAG: DUF2304 domain-containing protein [Chloroflexota bacterium]
MIDRALIFGLAASVTTLVLVLELVRQRRLKEEYSLLWLATGLVLLVLSLSRPLLDVLASAVGIAYPPSALFLVAVVFILFILLQFSAVLSRLSRENKEMAQQMAILRYELQLLRDASTMPDHQHSDEQNRE